MIYKVGIMGISGRVGQELAALLASNYEVAGKHLELADGISKSKKFTSVEGVDVRTPGEPPREPVHVWVDFSRPEGTLSLLEEINTPVVIGTTGFTDAQKARVVAYAQKQPVLLTSNTSPGLNIVKGLLETLPSGLTCDVVLAEDHHKKKVDAPSGTAKTLLQVLEKKGFENVQVQVTRAGQIIGNHTVRLITDDEEIEITHRVSNRRVFARGALQAAAFLVGKEPGLYEMKDVFFGGKR